MKRITELFLMLDKVFVSLPFCRSPWPIICVWTTPETWSYDSDLGGMESGLISIELGGTVARQSPMGKLRC